MLDLSRIGKRIVWHFAGRRILRLSPDDRRPVSLEEAQACGPTGKKNDLAAFGFPTGTLMLTEASKKKRASLHVVARAASRSPCTAAAASSRSHARSAEFRPALTRENHTLKRALADPRLFSRHRQRL